LSSSYKFLYVPPTKMFYPLHQLFTREHGVPPLLIKELIFQSAD
jgi:hypothetical protein